tara:strand:+ start:694 stop:798 length:105 start_codon:yes stop_codon:yes gene_type:complete
MITGILLQMHSKRTDIEEVEAAIVIKISDRIQIR